MKYPGLDRWATLNRLTEEALGDAVICSRCGASVATFDDLCSAALDDQCPGFLKIDETKKRLLGEGKARG